MQVYQGKAPGSYGAEYQVESMLEENWYSLGKLKSISDKYTDYQGAYNMGSVNKPCAQMQEAGQTGCQKQIVKSAKAFSWGDTSALLTQSTAPLTLFTALLTPSIF